MLPRLSAEEQIAGVEATALGSGSYERSDAQRMMRRLRDAATGQQGRTRGQAASPGQLAALGIGVISAPARKALTDV